MRLWRLSLLASLLAATAACHDSKPARETGKAAKPPVAAAPPPTELVALAWTPANRDQNLQAFDLQLTGAELVSICRKPPGWVLERTDGGIKGYATVGAGFVSVEHLGDLTDLFLIRPNAGQTLGVKGKLLTGVYADDGGQSEIAATPALLRRSLATECPKA